MSPVVDDGYFPHGSSMLRRVHSHRAVGLMYGQRALAIGAIAPLNFVGTVRHTRALGSPFRRLVHTAKSFETIYFGTREEADRVLAFVHRLHEPVHGELGEDAGATPKGTAYSAFDPAEMLWTIAVAADSAIAFYELFVRRLSVEEKDAFWRDYVRFGELFGMPRDVAPSGWGEFREYFDGFVNGPEAHLVEEGRHIGLAILFEIPVPGIHAPAMQLHNLVQRGALPARVREMYGLRWSALDALAYRGSVAALGAALRVAPGAVRRGHNTTFYDLVGDTERRLIRSGRDVPGALPGTRYA